MGKRKHGGLIFISGLVTAAFAAAILVSVLSYCFTWRADQSLLHDPAAMDPASQVHNTGGKMGFHIGYFLVEECAGLASFVLVVMFAIAA